MARPTIKFTEPLKQKQGQSTNSTNKQAKKSRVWFFIMFLALFWVQKKAFLAWLPRDFLSAILSSFQNLASFIRFGFSPQLLPRLKGFFYQKLYHLQLNQDNLSFSFSVPH